MGLLNRSDIRRITDRVPIHSGVGEQVVCGVPVRRYEEHRSQRSTARLGHPGRDLPEPPLQPDIPKCDVAEFSKNDRSPNGIDLSRCD